MRSFGFLCGFVLAGVLGYPLAASAQGAVVHASTAAAIGDSNTGVAFGGGVGYRFNRVLGFGVELTDIEGLDNFAYLFGPGFDDPDGNAIVFTTNVRVEIPTTLSHVVPFVIGGGGVASLSRSFPIVYATLASQVRTVLPTSQLSISPILPGPSSITSTSVSMALTLGGGASFLVTNHLSVDADLRILRLLGENNRNIGRFGGGVSYRF